MKTDELITLLASQMEPIDRSLPTRRYLIALAISAIGAGLLLLPWLGIRPDISSVITTPVFWIKLAFPSAIAIVALLLATRLARPGLPIGRCWGLLAMPVIAVWLGALITLGLAPASERVAMVLGISWRSCPFNITYLSIPGFVAIFWAMKSMAPTRPRSAGAIAGLLASSVATIVYCLHCPEMEVAFWAVWYLAGMLLPALIGGLLGHRLLRW